LLSRASRIAEPFACVAFTGGDVVEDSVFGEGVAPALKVLDIAFGRSVRRAHDLFVACHNSFLLLLLRPFAAADCLWNRGDHGLAGLVTRRHRCG
jgi:hypothetical protein